MQTQQEEPTLETSRLDGQTERGSPLSFERTVRTWRIDLRQIVAAIILVVGGWYGGILWSPRIAPLMRPAYREIIAPTHLHVQRVSPPQRAQRVRGDQTFTVMNLTFDVALSGYLHPGSQFFAEVRINGGDASTVGPFPGLPSGIDSPDGPPGTKYEVRFYVATQKTDDESERITQTPWIEVTAPR